MDEWGIPMGLLDLHRRDFLKTTAAVAASTLLPKSVAAYLSKDREPENGKPADHTIRIGVSPIEISPDRIISMANYNGQFPGPLLRFKEGQRVTVDLFNDTDSPEQLHWHGQKIPTDVDGAAEEGTPYIPAHGKRRIEFTPGPAGFRFYHTHNRAGG